MTEEETQPEGIEKELVPGNVPSIQQPSVQESLDPFIDSDEISEYYANILGIRISPHDVEMVFGLARPGRGPKALIRIRTSRSHFQAIGKVITQMVEQEKVS